MKRLLIFILILTPIAAVALTRAPAAQTRPDPQFINMVEPWPYPFSSAVRTGNLLFVSGQIGSRVENGAPVLVPGGIEPESRQALYPFSSAVRTGNLLFVSGQIGSRVENGAPVLVTGRHRA